MHSFTIDILRYKYDLSTQPEIHDKEVKDYFEAGKNLKSLELVAFTPLRLIDISGSVSSNPSFQFF